jgi:4-hydroxybenzoate polyprenyltransferase
MTTAFIKLMRPLNAFIAGLGVWVGYICLPNPIPFNLALIDFLCFIFLAAAGNVHNDVCDLKTDLINRPHRPIPAGLITLKFAWIGSWILYCISFALGILHSALHGGVLFICIFLLYAYNRHLKGSAWVGNIIVALLCGTAILYPALESGWHIKLLPAILFAFFINWSREIIKDIEDLRGDFLAGVETAPVLLGPDIPLFVARFLLIIVIFGLGLPVFFQIYSAFFLWLSLPLAGLPLVLALWRTFQSDPDWHKIQTWIKIAMLGGLISIIAGVNF